MNTKVQSSLEKMNKYVRENNMKKEMVNISKNYQQ